MLYIYIYIYIVRNNKPYTIFKNDNSIESKILYHVNSKSNFNKVAEIVVSII